MAGSRPIGETPGQGGMSHLKKELHRERSQSDGPGDAAKRELKKRRAEYEAIPIPEGLPELPPSTLTERPHPGIMPPRRPSQPGVKRIDPAEAPVTLPEATDQAAAQAAPLGDIALQQMVDAKLGETPAQPFQAVPPTEPQA